jgi:hypothetical protein
LLGILGAFVGGLGRKLTNRGGAAIQGFPSVKLLSRFVTLRLTHDRSRGLAFAQGTRSIGARVMLKALADVAGKAVTLVITVLAARALNADAFGVMALAMATGWLLGVATDAGLSMHLARETARRGRPATPASDRRAAPPRRPRLSRGDDDRVSHAEDCAAELEDAVVLIVLAQLTGAVIETTAHYFRGIGAAKSNRRSTPRIASARSCLP